VFQNRVLRRIFGPVRDKVTAEWRRLHNEKLYALYSTPNIIRVIKSTMRRMRHIARMGRKDGHRILVGETYGKIISKWIFK
jgi:hypothetical protein